MADSLFRVAFPVRKSHTLPALSDEERGATLQSITDNVTKCTSNRIFVHDTVTGPLVSIIVCQSPASVHNYSIHGRGRAANCIMIVNTKAYYMV